MVMEWSPVLGTVNEFVDYALFFTGVAIIYFLVRLFMTTRPTKEERKAKEAEWAERGADTRKWVGDRWTAFKTKAKEEEEAENKKKEKGRVRDLARPLVDKIYNDLLPRCVPIVEKLNKRERKPALDDLEKLKKEVNHLWRGLRSLHRNVPEAKRNKVSNIMDKVHALEHLIETECIAKVPSRVDPVPYTAWTAGIAHVINKIQNKVGPDLGAIYTEIETLYSS